MTWTNIGNISPESGTVLVKKIQPVENGSLPAMAIEVRPESHIGGSDRVFRICHGYFSISSRNIDSALEAVGMQRDRRNMESGAVASALDCISARYDVWHGSIEIPDYFGKIRSIPVLDDRERLLALCYKSDNYGFEDLSDKTRLVMIGMPGKHEPEPRFDEEPIFYPAGTSLWAVLRDIYDDFTDMPESNPKKATPHDTVNRGSPFFGLSRKIRSKADLLKMGVFDCIADEDGIPKPWLNSYRHDKCPEALECDEEFTVWQEPTECIGQEAECDCGLEIVPQCSEWRGPVEPELVSLWQNLPWPEEVEPVSEATPVSEPDF